MAKRRRLLPCASCPWRVGATAKDIPNYDHDKACDLLLSTVGDGDAFRNVMACHGSTEDAPLTCLGYLARKGHSNLRVRLMLARGKLPTPDDVLDACTERGIELHEDYEDVLAKLSRTR